MPADDFSFKVGRETRWRARKSPAEVQFQGYRQVAVKGKKQSDITYDVVVSTLDFAELQAAFDFLELKDGLPFTWTPPVAPIVTQKSWTCKEYNGSYGSEGGLIVGLTAVFVLFNTP